MAFSSDPIGVAAYDGVVPSGVTTVQFSGTLGATSSLSGQPVVASPPLSTTQAGTSYGGVEYAGGPNITVIIPASGSFPITSSLSGAPNITVIIPASGSLPASSALLGQPALYAVVTITGGRTRSGTPLVAFASPPLSTTRAGTSYGGVEYAGGPNTTVIIPLLAGGRTRSGSLYVSSYSQAVGPLPAANSFRRWRFDDPQTGAAYVFGMNPNTGGSAAAKRTLTSVATTAANGLPLVFEGEMEALTGQFAGVMQTQAQYDAFKTWFAKRYPILLTDDLGRRSYIVMTKFDPKRKWSSTHSFRQTYTINYKLLQQLDV